MLVASIVIINTAFKLLCKEREGKKPNYAYLLYLQKMLHFLLGKVCHLETWVSSELGDVADFITSCLYSTSV